MAHRWRVARETPRVSGNNVVSMCSHENQSIEERTLCHISSRGISLIKRRQTYNGGGTAWRVRGISIETQITWHKQTSSRGSQRAASKYQQMK